MSNFLDSTDDDDSGIEYDFKNNRVIYTGAKHARARQLQVKENARRVASGRKPMTIEETVTFMRNADAV